MKLILAILALSCSAMAMPEDRLKRDIQAVRESCPGRCVMTDKYREWFTQALPKARELGKQLAEGQGGGIFPTLQPEKWEEYCREVGSIKTCIGNCNDPGDADKKTKAEAVLTAASDLICDNDIKAKFPCLQEVSKVPSPTCNEQCAQFKQPIIDAYNQYKQTGQRDWDRAKNAGKNVCLLVNCRLKCRKNDIEQKCQADGFAAAKKVVQKLATLGKTTHAQFRPAQNFPEECNPEKVVEGT